MHTLTVWHKHFMYFSFFSVLIFVEKYINDTERKRKTNVRPTSFFLSTVYTYSFNCCPAF